MYLPTPRKSPFPISRPAEPAPTQYEDDRSGGELRIEYTGDFIPDPALGYFPEDFFFQAEMYSGLTRITNDSSALTENELAEAYTVSNDGHNYEFRLRPDLKFSDGSPVTAEDFKWSWERALSPELGSQWASTMLGEIAGADEILAGSSDELNGVVAVDDRTIKITLTTPVVHFPALLAHPVASVLKKDNVENWGFNWSRIWEPRFDQPGQDTFDEFPVGTGPFALTAFDDWEGTATLSRNPFYWNRNAFIERIEFAPWSSVFEDGQQSTEIDLLRRRTDISFISEGSPNLLGVFGKIVESEVSSATEFLVFNTAVTPFDDVRFRRALAASIPSGSFAMPNTLDFPPDISGFSIANGILPPDNPGFDSSRSKIPENPQFAIDEYQQSVYAGQDVNIRFRYYFPQDSAFMEAVTARWRELFGIDASVEEVDFESYRRWKASGQRSMGRNTVIPAYPDAHAILGAFADVFPGAHSPENTKINEMLANAAAEPDASTRLDLYREIEAYIIDEAIAVPLLWSNNLARVTMQPWVHGYERPKYHGSRFVDVWIDRAHPDFEPLGG